MFCATKMSYKYNSDVATNFHACINGKNLCHNDGCHRCKQILADLREQKRINDYLREQEEEYQKRKKDRAAMMVVKDANE